MAPFPFVHMGSAFREAVKLEEYSVFAGIQNVEQL